MSTTSPAPEVPSLSLMTAGLGNLMCSYAQSHCPLIMQSIVRLLDSICRHPEIYTHPDLSCRYRNLRRQLTANGEICREAPTLDPTCPVETRSSLRIL